MKNNFNFFDHKKLNKKLNNKVFKIVITIINIHYGYNKNTFF